MESKLNPGNTEFESNNCMTSLHALLSGNTRSTRPFDSLKLDPSSVSINATPKNNFKHDRKNVNLEKKANKKIYTENDAVDIVKVLVKEFTGVMENVNMVRTPSYLDMFNMNTVLLLSLISKELNEMGGLILPNLNLLQQIGSMNMHQPNNNFGGFNPQNLFCGGLLGQNNGLSGLKDLIKDLKQQKYAGMNISKEEDSNPLASFGQPQNFYKHTKSASPVKLYERCFADTKDDSDAAPSVEAKPSTY